LKIENKKKSGENFKMGGFNDFMAVSLSNLYQSIFFIGFLFG